MLFGKVCLVDLVCCVDLIHLVGFVQLNKPDTLNNGPPTPAECFNNLPADGPVALCYFRS